MGVPTSIVPSIAAPEHVEETWKRAFTSGDPEDLSRYVVQHEFSSPSFLLGCCCLMWTLGTVVLPLHALDHRAIGIDGLEIITETALTLTLCVPEMGMPNRFINGVRNIGVCTALLDSSATRTPLALANGTL